MKKIIAGLLVLLAGAGISLAGSIAEYPTFSANIQQATSSAGYSSVSMLLYGGAIQFPMNDRSEIKIGYSMGSNYGVNSTIIEVAYKVEIK